MMKVWDSELLTAKKSGGIVTNGLTVWVDFFDTITDSKIQNRAGDDEITLSPSSWQSYFSQNNGFLRISATGSAANHTYFNCEQNNTVSSFEITGNLAHLNSGSYIAPAGNYNYWTGTSSTKVLGRYDANSRKMDVPYINAYYYGNIVIGDNEDVVKHYCFVRQENKKSYKIYVNGVLVTTSNDWRNYTDEFVATQIARFGDTRLTNDGSVGTDIASIRTYNRPLTDEEVVRNMQYEISTGRLNV